MRLIDADALLEQIVHTNNVYVQGRMAYIIDNIPTAYDIEKVVAELEYQKEKCEEDMRYYEEKSWKDHVSHTNYDLFFMKSDCLEDVIEIVKRGGVE